METFLEKFDHKLIALGWSLWTELGVAGNQRKHTDCLIGIEELIILTAVIAEFDPRLRDEALDWLTRYHHVVSISRLRTLVKTMGESVYLPFSIFAKTLNSTINANWPIFLNVDALEFIPSGKSSPPNFKAPALLGLRLRKLFGIGARADLLTFLLTQSKTIFTAADVVEVGYNKRSLADILDNLVECGLFDSEMVRNQRKYEIKKKEQLRKLVGELPNYAPPWHRILKMLVLLRVNIQQFQKNSATTNAVIMKNTLSNMTDLLPSIISSSPSQETDLNQYLEKSSKWLLDTLNSFANGNFLGHFDIDDEFDKRFFSLMQDVYVIDDCLDGTEFTISCAEEYIVKHTEVFKENYQLCYSYIDELKIALEKLRNFPFHQLKDFELSDIHYLFFKEDLPHVLKVVSTFPLVNLISNPRQALKQYEALKIELNTVHKFMHKLKDHLKKIYFLKTHDNLLTLSNKLHKRHIVLQLFSLA